MTDEDILRNCLLGDVVEPFYPLEARKDFVQCVVELEVRTDEEGKVTEAEVLKSDSSLLNQASIDAVRQWKYEPVISNGKPVPVSFIVNVTHTLK